MKRHLQLFILLIFFALIQGKAQTTTQSATLTVSKSTTYQKTTRFGGFVCSPHFGALFVEANSIKQDNYLLPIYYSDYANYLHGYAIHLKQNGVELDAISVQNEPDECASYQGCIWNSTQIFDFDKNYGPLINCPIMALPNQRKFYLLQPS